jgi:hypothetical protein
MIFHLYMICPEDNFNREDLSSLYDIPRGALHREVFHLYMIYPEKLFHREDLSSLYDIPREALSQR